MKIWLKENWFKIGLLIILVIGVFVFERKASQVDQINEDIALPADQDVVDVPIQDTPSNVEKSITRQTKEDAFLMVTTQLKAFDDFLEYSLVGAQVDCIVLASYNNVISARQMDQQSFQQAFPDSKESYENKCRSSYLDVVANQKLLIAEPELQSLRILLTSYSDEIKSLGSYALSGGSDASHIDNSDKRMDNLRTLSREEIINLRRKYNID